MNEIRKLMEAIENINEASDAPNIRPRVVWEIRYGSHTEETTSDSREAIIIFAETYADYYADNIDVDDEDFRAKYEALKQKGAALAKKRIAAYRRKRKTQWEK